MAERRNMVDPILMSRIPRQSLLNRGSLRNTTLKMVLNIMLKLLVLDSRV